MNKGFGYILLILIGSNIGVAQNVIIHSNTETSVNIVGYDLFAKKQLVQLNLKINEPIHYTTKYDGLSVLQFRDGQAYPMVLNGNTIELHITDANLPLAFTNSVANNDLYNWLAAYRANNHNSDLMLQSSQAFGPTDPFLPTLFDEIKALDGNKEKIKGTIDNISDPVVKACLGAYVLIASSGEVKTMQDLDRYKVKFSSFIAQNLEELQHSDMLIKLCNQYFMMHEYVGYTPNIEEGETAKNVYSDKIVAGVEQWIQLLQNKLSKRAVIAHCGSIYFNRGMITQSSAIFDAFPETFRFPTSEVFEKRSMMGDYKVIDKQGNPQPSVWNKPTKKIMVLIDGESTYAKSKLVMTLREMGNSNKDYELIVAASSKDKQSILNLSKLTTTNFHIIDDVNIQGKVVESTSISPLQFVLLDKDNRVKGTVGNFENIHKLMASNE